MTFTSRIRKNHRSSLISSLEKMMKREILCDFIIKVDDNAFPVHRVVLAATSKYFDALFSSEMKEVTEGFVQMVGVETSTMKRSIDFMYTGAVDVYSQTVESMLSSATLLQLDGLAELCFHFLETNITVNSCLRAVRLARLYGRESLQESAKIFVAKHFEDIIAEPDFPEIPKEDLMRYIRSSNASHEIAWKAVVGWLDDFDSKNASSYELVRFLGVQEFSFSHFNEIVMNETNLPNNMKSQLVKQYFSYFDKLKSRLSVQNYFDIRSHVAAHAIPNKQRFKELLGGFLVENFEQLSQMEEFIQLTEEEILPVLQNTKNQYFPEQTKWEAAVKWTEYNENRTNAFSRLFSTINLNLLPSEFLQESICGHNLVNASHQCKDLMLKFLCIGAKSVSNVTWLDKSRGEILTFDPAKRQISLVLRTEGGVGVANVKGDFYLATKENLWRLNKNATWTTLPQPPCKIQPSCNLLCFQGCMYAVYKDSTQWYNPRSNKWTANSRYSRRVADGTCVAASNHEMYALGGVEEHGRGWILTPTDEVLTFFGDNWSSSSSKMKNKRAYASAAVLRDTVWVLGGGTNAVEFYQPVSGVWTEMPAMLVSRSKFGSCVLGNRLYVVGGGGSNGNPVEGDSIEFYDVETRKWKFIQTIKSISNGVSCCSYSPPQMLKLTETLS